jgi:Ethanolamine utilization protein EutJ (predicted chaperonin)
MMAVARERVVWGVVVREGVVWRAREAVKTGEARREAVETGEGMEARRAARGVTTALETVAGTKVVVVVGLEAEGQVGVETVEVTVEVDLEVGV